MAGELKTIYNNQLIRTSTADDTFTLACNGKLMASDVTIQATDVDSLTVTYGGNTIATGSGTVTKILNCDGRVATSDIGVAVTMNSAPTEYFITFSSPDVFSLSVPTKGWDGTLQYSVNKSDWFTWDGTSISSANLAGKQVLCLRGSGNTQISKSIPTRWILVGSNISCEGNIETLLDYNTVSDGNHPTMAASCFTYMFYNCTSLITPPSLPATTLAQSCYNNMFYNCKSLTTAPALPATTLANSCYKSMFRGCTSLTTLPSLPATILTTSCYEMMFSDCTLIKLSTTQTGEYQTAYRIPSSGTGTTALYALELMFNGTGGSFAGKPTINTTYYTSNTVIS